LELIDSTFSIQYDSDGTTKIAEYGMYFHPRYPNHTPVFCGMFYTVYNVDGAFMCALEYGSRYATPVFNHGGAVVDEQWKGDMCNCSELEDIEASYCQWHDGLFGLLLFNEGNGYTEMSLVGSEYSAQFQMNELAYRASFNAIVTSEQDASAFDFCEVNGSRCSLVVLRIFDQNKQVSDNYLTLDSAACVDTFSTPEWEQLVSAPPTQLEEDYFTCTQYWYDAVFDSLGIASVCSVLHVCNG
jgi:hypothetical protein